MIRIKGRLSAAAIKALQAGKLPPQSEDNLQKAIVAELRAKGYTVLITSRRRKKCRKCGDFQPGGDGADKGVPDLLVALYGDETWPAGMLLGLEVKKPGKIRYSSQEQELYAKLGVIDVVQSVEDAVRRAELIASVAATP